MATDPNMKFVKEAFEFTWDRLTNNLRMQEMFPWAWDAAQDALKVETVFYTIRSDKDNATPTGFQGACVQNAQITANLTGLASNKIRIKRIRAQAIQNLHYQWHFWSTDTFLNADLDLDSFRGKHMHDAISGEQIAAANQFYYDSGIVDFPYEDLDGTFELHASVVNRSALAKAAAAAGNLVLDVDYEVAG